MVSSYASERCGASGSSARGRARGPVARPDETKVRFGVSLGVASAPGSSRSVDEIVRLPRLVLLRSGVDPERDRLRYAPSGPPDPPDPSSELGVRRTLWGVSRTEARVSEMVRREGIGSDDPAPPSVRRCAVARACGVESDVGRSAIAAGRTLPRLHVATAILQRPYG